MKNEVLRLLEISKNCRNVSKSESEDESIKDGLIEEMEFVASDMHSLAKTMDHFLCASCDMKEKSEQLMAASYILEQWAAELKEGEK